MEDMVTEQEFEDGREALAAGFDMLAAEIRAAKDELAVQACLMFATLRLGELIEGADA
jgi:hypothetical protein